MRRNRWEHIVLVAMCRNVEIAGRTVKLGLVTLMILKLSIYGVQQMHGIR
jgi:hypothetical protein